MFHFPRICIIVPSPYMSSIALWIFDFRSVFFGATAIPTGCGSMGWPTIWIDGSFDVYQAAGGESDS